MSPVYELNPLKFRAVWISDVHLGFKGCRADYLLDFLRATECEYLFLVGDIIDVRNMKSGLFWPQSHNNVIRTILGKSKHGTKVVVVPGNHDEVFRDYDGTTFGNVTIRSEYIHTTADGRRLLLLHGDECDGVVKYSKLLALTKTGEVLERMGHTVHYITPEQFRTVPCTTYPSIRLALKPGKKLRRLLDGFGPNALHIATEGPLGLAARAYCRRRGLKFTTSFHTQFPEYVRMRAPIPTQWTYGFMRWFHSGAECTLVPTERRRQALLERGFKNLVIWTRGVDTQLFRPRSKAFLSDRRPVAMYVGRVAVEKNVEAFLSLDLPGTKYVVGDGPDLTALQRRYPDVRFAGFRFGDELANFLAAADVFVFPSLTDTFGLVLLEAMGCGVPVAAYPVPGPVDVVESGVTGVLGEDLGAATLKALELDPAACRSKALSHSWETATEQFLSHLVSNGSNGATWSVQARS